MKIIGLTGGMGTGKSTVARLFENKGFPIYNSDLRAKELMVENQNLKKELICLIGEEAYSGNSLNREYIAKKIFSDSDLLKKQNALVHAAVREDFMHWVSVQRTEFCIKEAAILFESGSYKDCDYVIGVIAPEDIRIKRIIERDHLSEGDIRKRLQNQWPQEKIRQKSDFCIVNYSDLINLEKQVEDIIVCLKQK